MMAKVTGKRLAVLAARDAKALQSIMDRVQPGVVIAVAVDRHIADAARNVGRAKAVVRACDMLDAHTRRLSNEHTFITLGRGDLRRKLLEPILPTAKVVKAKARHDA